MTIQQVGRGQQGRRRIAGEQVRRTTSVAPAPPATATRQTSTRNRKAPAVWLIPGLAILLAAALVFDTVVVVRRHVAESRSEAAGSSAADVAAAYQAAPPRAEQAAEALLSYEVESLQSDAEAATQYLTPAYAATFHKTVDAFLARSAPSTQRRVTAEVMASGVVSATASHAEVLLFVDQTSSTGGARSASQEPQTALNRVLLSMVKTGDAWLVDDVTAL